MIAMRKSLSLLTATLCHSTYVFILYQTTAVLTGIIFGSVNAIGENICKATQIFLKIF